MAKTVLITGAGSGFGRGAASELAKRGHKVIAGVLNDAQAAELSKAEPRLTVAKLDITVPNDVAKIDQWDLDVFVANAALGQTGPMSLIPAERLRAVFEVNVFATVAVTQRAALKMRMKRSGRIILMSSIGGVRAGVGSGPYTMTKHAIQAFGTALRAELKMFGVDVCLINPGPYATGFNDRMANDPGPWFDRKKVAPEDLAVMDQLVQRITVGQMNPAEVVKRYVELVEADTTELVNFVPPDIVERMSKSMPAR
ncbi:MAG TPA: SDR family NAD(P)-dependent oxidoreductase [Burkholderiales bacterium]|jgi:short-subunit dehydrogenase|nr:SDR family NAD(P)-dependent oxidoreductase [Burkholderiales bacterium]